MSPIFSSPYNSDEVDVAEMKARLAANPEALIIDVREQNEWDAGHIDGAHFLPLSALNAGVQADFPKDSDIILYCKAGRRSLTALAILRAQGFENLVSLKVGYDGWAL